MIKKLNELITGSVGAFNKIQAIILVCRVCNEQTNKINELIDKVNELDKKLTDVTDLTLKQAKVIERTMIYKLKSEVEHE